MISRIDLMGLMAAALLLTSCVNTGTFISSHNTTVELSEDNYEVVATDVEGLSEAGYLFGFSYSYGVITNSLSLARISGSPFLYQNAMDNLWTNFEQEHGEVAGQKLALTNVRYDADLLNLVVYNKIQLSVRADIVRFTE